MNDILEYMFERSQNEIPDIAVSATPLKTRVELESNALKSISGEQGYFKTTIRLPGSTNHYLVEILEKMIEKLLYTELREKRGWLYCSNINSEYLGAAWLVDIECNVKKESWLEAERVIEEVFSKLEEARQLFWDIRLYLVKRLDLMGPEQIHLKASELLSSFGLLESARKQQSRLERMKFHQLFDLIRHFRPEHRFTVLRPPMGAKMWMM